MPLRKVKTLRETLRGKNLLNNFLEERAYRLFKNDSKTAILPLRNFLDVSLLGGWFSSAPLLCSGLALLSFLAVAGGKLGLGLLQEAETLGNRDSTPEEKAFSSSTLGLW